MDRVGLLMCSGDRILLLVCLLKWETYPQR